MSTLKPEVKTKDHKEGNQNAKIVLVEFGDYQCPYCGEAFPIIKNIQKKLGDKMMFVFRNFPLTEMHPYALDAARAAEAAALQGKFWDMHDILYKNQENLEESDLVDYAKKLGLDLDKFKEDMVSRVVEEKINSDIESGAISGVNGTPSFYIDGKRYDDSYEEDVLLPYLESLE